MASDTREEASDRQLAIYRAMLPERRVELAAELSQAARELTSAGIRSRHPAYSDREVRFALYRLLLGDALFQQAYPSAPVLAP